MFGQVNKEAIIRLFSTGREMVLLPKGRFTMCGSKFFGKEQCAAGSLRVQAGIWILGAGDDEPVDSLRDGLWTKLARETDARAALEQY